MFLPRKNALIFRFFSWYISRIIRTDFKSFNFNKLSIDPDQAVLLIANHFSWWDGFFMFHLNKILFKKKFYILVSEENYRTVRFLKYLGAFAVKPGVKDLMQTLDYAGGLLNNPENLVLIFPQGKIFSGHTASVDFQKGLMNVIKASEGNFQYVFAVIFVDHFQHRKPSVNVYLKTWNSTEYTTLQLVKNEFNKHYTLSREQQGTMRV